MAPEPLTRRRLLARSVVLSAGGIAATTVGSAGQTARRQQASPQTITCGTTVTGEITGDDAAGFRGPRHYQDEYTFAGEADQSVSITMVARRSDGRDGTTSTGAATTASDGDPYLYLLGPDGTIVAEDDDSADGRGAFVSQQSLPATGTYTIVATSFDAAASFEYELTLTCGSSLDPAPIQCDETVTNELVSDGAIGILGPNRGQDAYVFEAGTGEVVDITMSALDTTDDSNGAAPASADPVLVLLDPDGSLLAVDDDSGGDLDAALTATLVAGGRYTIVATSAGPGQSFAYELSLSCREPIDAESIECGQTVTGQLTPDDASGVRTDSGVHYHDAYAFDGEQGDQVTITMESRRDNGLLGDPYLSLFGPDGTVIAEDDDCGGELNSLVRHRLPTDGQYTVVATSVGASEFFTYELSLTCGNLPVPLPEAGQLRCGDRVVGELGANDPAGFRGPDHFHDLYEFDGSTGDLVTLSLSASDGDPYLYVLDPTDSIVAEDDDGGGGLDSLIRNYRLQQSGTYLVVVTSSDEQDFFEYNLALQCLSGTDSA